MGPTKKEIPKLGPKKQSTAGTDTRKATSPAIRPSATPSQSSADVPKKQPPKLGSRQNSQASFGSTQARRPSAVPRRPSNLSGRTASTDKSRQPPKLPSRQTSGVSPSPSQIRKPSQVPRRPSNLSKTSGAISERKPPKLAPKQNGPNRKASIAPKTDQTVTQAGAAHKVDEDQQDLKSILSDAQCEDLVQLTASITNRMRKGIEDNFNATATLKTLKNGDTGGDKFASLDYDPGSVDVGAYDKEKKLRNERQKELSTPKVKELKKASLRWFDDWQSGFLKRVDETVNPGETPSLQRAQGEEKSEASLAAPRPVQRMSASPKDADQTSPKLEQLFPRVQTSLTKMPMGRRTLILHSYLLLLLSLEHYNAASRVFLLYLASSLKLGLKALRDDEEKTAKSLLEAAKQISASKESLAKGRESEESRRWKMRLATVAGAAIVGLSGGYAAPMLAAAVGSMMSEMGLGASAAAGYLGSVAGNTYVVGSLFGAYGGRMTGEMMRNLSADVEDFAFLPVHGERKEHDDSISAATESRRLRVIIAISGWLLEKEEVVTPWRVLKPSAECFALRYEIETLMSLGQSINTMRANDAYGFAETAFTQRAMVTDLTSVIWPLALVKIARVVENPFSLAKARSDKAGKVLAEALINRTQGERPVTLVAYSLGTRVVWSCLTTLAERGAFGLVESVVLLGAPIPSDIGTWRSMRAAVTGRLINVYSKNDYLLAFLYRTSSLQYGVSGLMPISGLSGVENYDVSETVSGHLWYRYLVGSILQKIGFEDVDKDEVAKEAEAFKKMTEQEIQKRDYVEEVKEGASELYKQYAKRGKQPPNKKISDKEADKQVSAMEKEVQQKTQKGLMQWAVEQLYLSGPNVPSTNDVKNVRSDPQAAAKGTRKSVNKTADAATKSVYQRAKEAVYISRSGGSKGQDAAKGKLAEAQGTTSSAVPSSYLATAAGYVPTSYIPGFGAAGSAKKESEKATGVAKPVSEIKDRDVSKAAKATKKKKKPTKEPKDAKALSQSEGNQGDIDTSTETTSSTRQFTPEGSSNDSSKNSSKEAPEDVLEESPTIDDPQPSVAEEESASEATQSTNPALGEAEKTASEKASASTGYSSYIPSFGFGSSSKTSTQAPAPSTPPSTSGADKPTENQKDTEENQPATKDSSDTTPTNAERSKKAESPAAKAPGYGSYFPSFSYRGSASKPAKSPAQAPTETKQETTDEGSKDVNDEQKEPTEDPFVE